MFGQQQQQPPNFITSLFNSQSQSNQGNTFFNLLKLIYYYDIEILIYIITKDTPLDKIKPLFLLNCNMCYRSLPL